MHAKGMLVSSSLQSQSYPLMELDTIQWPRQGKEVAQLLPNFPIRTTRP